MELNIGDKVDVTLKVTGVDEDIIILKSGDFTFSFTKYEFQNILTGELSEVPKVAIEFYRFYKGSLSGFDEWFSDFYDRRFLEEFPQGEKLAQWLYDNDTETNLKRELALATLIVKGEDSVKVTQTERKYVVYLMYVDQDYSMLHQNLGTGKLFFGKQTNIYNQKSMFTLEELDSLGFKDALNNPLLKVEPAF